MKNNIINFISYTIGILLILFLIKYLNYYISKENYGKLIIIFFLIINIFLGIFFRNFRKKSLIITVYFLIIIYVTNLMIAYITYSDVPLNKMKSILEKKKIKYDNRSWIDYVLDERKLGRIIYPYVTPIEFLEKNKTNLFFLTPMPNTTYAACNEYGRWKDIKTDKFGFNNENIKKKYQILLMGDSFAEGSCVNKEFEPAKILSNVYKKDTYSIGVSGNGPLLSFAILHEIKKYISSEEIIWLFYDNDFHDLSKEVKSNFLIQYINESFDHLDYYKNIDFVTSSQKRFIETNLSSFKKYSLTQDILELKPLIHRINILISTVFKKKSKNIDDESNIFNKIFIKLKKLHPSDKIKIVYIPDNTCFSKMNKSCEKNINTLKKNLGDLRFYDFFEYINNNFKDYRSLYALGIDRAHLSEVGYVELIKFINK